VNDYRPALDQLRERRKGKPGELRLIIGLALMVVSPFVLAIVHGEGTEYDALKAQGVVAIAEISDHEQREESYTDRKGRSKSRTNHYLKVRYDLNAATGYTAWKASGKLAPSQYPVITTTELMVPQSYLATNAVGAKRPVVLMRGNSSKLELVEQLEYETSASYFLKYYLAMAALFGAGLVMTVVGWRRRFPRA
jgi:hypothetical protein